MTTFAKGAADAAAGVQLDEVAFSAWARANLTVVVGDDWPNYLAAHRVETLRRQTAARAAMLRT